MGCRLLRFVCSLASAGNVCLAKPNHAFFNCQHSCRIFFGVARRRIATHAHRWGADIRQRLLRASALRRAMALHASTDAACGNTCTQRSNAACVASLAMKHAECTHGTSFEQLGTTAMRTCVCASHKPDCAKTARTFFAMRSTSHPFSRARVAEKGKPATLPPRVDGCVATLTSIAVSDRRRPATRHSRPDRADR